MKQLDIIYFSIKSLRETEAADKEKKIRKEALDNIKAMEELECLKKAEEVEVSCMFDDFLNNYSLIFIF